jgi:hypothetical protein
MAVHVELYIKFLEVLLPTWEIMVDIYKGS